MACVSLFNELYAILRVCECVISRALLVHVSLFNELYAILVLIYELCECVISRALIVHVSLFGQDPDSDADLEADFPSLEVGRQREYEKLIGQAVCV